MTEKGKIKRYELLSTGLRTLLLAAARETTMKGGDNFGCEETARAETAVTQAYC